jgi:hypothetical protein
MPYIREAWFSFFGFPRSLRLCRYDDVSPSRISTWGSSTTPSASWISPLASSPGVIASASSSGARGWQPGKVIGAVIGGMALIALSALVSLRIVRRRIHRCGVSQLLLRSAEESSISGGRREQDMAQNRHDSTASSLPLRERSQQFQNIDNTQHVHQVGSSHPVPASATKKRRAPPMLRPWSPLRTRDDLKR